MLSNDTIVKISVHTSRSAESPRAWDTGLILGRKGSGSEISVPKAYTSAADLPDDGYTEEDEIYRAAVKYFAATPAPARVILVSCGQEATPVAALDRAVESGLPFYGIYCCDNSAPAVMALISRLGALRDSHVLFYEVLGPVEEALDPEGIFSLLKENGTRCALGLYAHSALDGAALLGTAMGLALHNRASAFSLCYKQVSGIQPAGLTESQAASLKNLNANVYVARGGTRLMLENGSVASGLRYDEVLYIDQIASSLQEAAVSLLADHAGKLPQTDETSAVFINRFSSILSGFTAMGVLATAVWRGSSAGRLSVGDVVENGYSLWADSYDAQSDADRAAHKAMPIHCALCLAGSVETLVLSIDVTI